MDKKDVYYLAEEIKKDLDNLMDDIKELNIFEDLKLSLQLAMDDCDNLMEEYEEAIIKEQNEENDYMNCEYERSVL